MSRPNLLVKKQRPAKVVRISDDLPIGHWMRRQLPHGASLRPYVEDATASALVGDVLDIVRQSGISRAEIAAALGVTVGCVHQMLRGPNLTVKSLGALLWACGQQATGLATELTGEVSR